MRKNFRETDFANADRCSLVDLFVLAKSESLFFNRPMDTETNFSNDDLKKLSGLCLLSAHYLYSAAQQVRNRGLKLLLKMYAEQRRQFAEEVQTLLGLSEPQLTLEQTDASLRRGWTNIVAGLIIKRQNRQRLLLKEALQREDELIQHYEALLQQSFPVTFASALHRHLVILQTERQRLDSLAAEVFETKLFVRLFDQEHKAKEVMAQLAEVGIPPAALDLVPIERFSVFGQEANENRRLWRNTVGSGILLGAGIGALLGLIPGLAHSRFFPEIGGIFGNAMGEIVLEWVSGGALIGMFFAFIFSLLIAQDTTEDDAYVYDETLQNGNMLLAVFAEPYNHSRVERIIGLKHEFEVKPIAA
jgi:hypothetical protein